MAVRTNPNEGILRPTRVLTFGQLESEHGIRLHEDMMTLVTRVDRLWQEASQGRGRFYRYPEGLFGICGVVANFLAYYHASHGEPPAELSRYFNGSKATDPYELLRSFQAVIHVRQQGINTPTPSFFMERVFEGDDKPFMPKASKITTRSGLEEALGSLGPRQAAYIAIPVTDSTHGRFTHWFHVVRGEKAKILLMGDFSPYLQREREKLGEPIAAAEVDAKHLARLASEAYGILAAYDEEKGALNPTVHNFKIITYRRR